MFQQLEGRPVESYQIGLHQQNETVDFKLANKSILAARINKVGERVWLKRGSMVGYTVCKFN